MHDIKLIRDDPQGFDAGLARRGISPQSPALLEADQRYRATLTQLQQALARRNEAARLIGQAKAQKDEARAQELMAEVGDLKAQVPQLEQAERDQGAALSDMLARLPNIPADDVPEGTDETGNVEMRRIGAPASLGFEARDHDVLAEPLGMDFGAAAKLSGARFVVLRGALARLERAIGQFMIDIQTTVNGYTECAVPLLVRDDAVFGTGQLPKAAEDMFQTTNGFWLIPTAEVSLTNLVRESILSEAELPMRLTALTPCFRSEAGAAGRDTRGMIRQHQFSKVEMVSITTPEQSAAEHERMTAAAEDILQRLGLAFRTVKLCSGDMGFTARKTYDLEVWLPGQKAYREISSCSNCGDFQARRMNARYRPDGDKQTRFVHTLNGSGLAVGRTLVAVLETYQQADGTVVVPDVLQPYMGGIKTIG
jgi:seryl-tRNA synthetase